MVMTLSLALNLDNSFGAAEQDTLTGGLGADIFVLGDANGVYYDDGDPLLTGESDFALYH